MQEIVVFHGALRRMSQLGAGSCSKKRDQKARSPATPDRRHRTTRSRSLHKATAIRGQIPNGRLANVQSTVRPERRAQQCRTSESLAILFLNEDWNWTLQRSGCHRRNLSTGDTILSRRERARSLARFRPTGSREFGNFRKLVMPALN